jgi:hypothetical protein
MGRMISRVREIAHHSRQVLHELPAEKKELLAMSAAAGAIGGIVLGHVVSINLEHVFESLHSVAKQDLASFIGGAIGAGLTTSGALVVVEAGMQEHPEAVVEQNTEL